MKGVASKWVSSKAERVADEYGSRILERDSQEAIGDGVSSEQSDNDIFLEVVGCVSKKKRISGLDPARENFIPSSTQSTGISMSEYMEMKSVISNLTAENQSLREQMLANQEKSDAENQHPREKMSEVHANQEKMLKFMETFSQSHQPPPSPPPTNKDGQQNDDEYYDELHG